MLIIMYLCSGHNVARSLAALSFILNTFILIMFTVHMESIPVVLSARLENESINKVLISEGVKYCRNLTISLAEVHCAS